MVTHEEYDITGSSRRNNMIEVQKLHNTSQESTSDSVGGGGNDEVNKEDHNGEEYK